MCRINPSESGHGGGFVPCDEYKLLEQKCTKLLEHREFLFNVGDNLIRDNEVLATRNVALCQERDNLKSNHDYLYNGLNKTLHPNGDGGFKPSGCDLLTFLKSDLEALRRAEAENARLREALEFYANDDAQAVECEILGSVYDRPATNALKGVGVMRQERDALPRAPRWTEYDGSYETLPEIGVHVLIVMNGIFKMVGRRGLSCFNGESIWASIDGDITWNINIGDRWMPWPEGVE